MWEDLDVATLNAMREEESYRSAPVYVILFIGSCSGYPVPNRVVFRS